MNNLEGVWYNELGSKMTLQVLGSNISGTYETKVGDAEGMYNLIGQVDGQTGNCMAIGWVVVWQNGLMNSDSVTSWSGQFRTDFGDPMIVTTWLLTTETSISNEWQSTIVGKDYFTKILAEEDKITENIKRGVVKSNPF
ncbi:avidin/streptavidin family protein [Emticicia fluvialis]|uniref:avidin/streptavidin family protein n=1 Tax=Emticicia fluvialis TaxID=2974474 RepID=UPI00216640A6|nr:avidin/streptavidin family protein [Emticicia fluvialis]